MAENFQVIHNSGEEINKILRENGEFDIAQEDIEELKNKVSTMATNLTDGEDVGTLQSSKREDNSIVAIGDNSIALGLNNVAGARGYYLKAIDLINKKIFLTDIQPTEDTLPVILAEGYDESQYSNSAFETPLYEVGNSFSIILSNYYTACSTIKSISNNVVEYNEELPFTTIPVKTPTFYRYSFSVIEHPEIGAAIVGNNAFAEGRETHSMGRFSHTEGYNTIANAYGHAEGNSNIAGGSAHAEGQSTKALGQQAHSEGYGTIAKGENTHAEGRSSIATGITSHAEGYLTESVGEESHAEGYSSRAVGVVSHAEGRSTTANGKYSHTEGNNTIAGESGEAAHAEGLKTQALAPVSHAEGNSTITSGRNSHAEGNSTTANGESAHAEGYLSVANGVASHVEGYKSTTGINAAYSHSEGENNIVNSKISHAEGQNNTIEENADFSHVEGSTNTIAGKYTHVEGYRNSVPSDYAHVEGRQHVINAETNEDGSITTPIGVHIEGFSHTVGIKAANSHTEGYMCKNFGEISHVEGYGSTAEGNYSHAEGRSTLAKGVYSHSEGRQTQAVASTTHVEGYGTIANIACGHVQGKFNGDVWGNYAHVVGNGTADNARSNAHTLDWNGNAWFAGNVEGKEIVGEIVNGNQFKINNEIVGGVSFSEEAPEDENIAAWVKRCMIGEREIVDIEFVNHNAGGSSLKTLTLKLLDSDPINFEELIAKTRFNEYSYPVQENDVLKKIHFPTGTPSFHTGPYYASGYLYIKGDNGNNKVVFSFPEADSGGSSGPYLNKEDFIGQKVYFGLIKNPQVDTRILLRNYNFDDSDDNLSNKWISSFTNEEIESLISNKIDSFSSKVVHLNGDEIISGSKTFSNEVKLYSIYAEENPLNIVAGAGINLSADTHIILNNSSAKMIIGAGIINFEGLVKVNGKEIALKGDGSAEGGSIDESNLVHKTDDEEISGIKTFSDEIVVTRISNGNQGLEIEGYDSQIVFKTQSCIILQGGSEINFDCSTVTKQGKSIATTDDITAAIGDIETALDELHAYAQTLVTGGDN